MTVSVSSPRSVLRAGCLLVALPVFLSACGRARGGGDSEDEPRVGRVTASVVHADSNDVRWDAIRRRFGVSGRYEDGYFRVEFPRTDLQVRIGDHVLDPAFELTSFFGFAPGARGRVMAMGELVMRPEEVAATVAEARAQGVSVAALHNHLLGEEPRIVYMHLFAEGPVDSVAARLRAVLARTGAPPRPADRAEPSTADWKGVDGVLGEHEEAEGPVAEYVFPRKEAHAVHGMEVESSGVLETATEVVFQDLGAGRAAVTGEAYVRPTEVDAVVSALETHGLHVTALHTHMIDESPRMYWIHWYATGDGPTLARGVAAALAATNSERKSRGGD